MPPTVSRRAHRVVTIGVSLAGVLGLAACSSPTNAAPSIPTVKDDLSATAIPAFYTPPRQLPTAPAGTLIREEVVTGVPGVPAGAKVWRILYHSRSIYGDDIAESGY